MQIIALTAARKWTEVTKLANKPHTRERVLAVERILEFSSKPLTVPAIVQKVTDIYGINADAGTVHADIKALKMFF